MPPLDSSAQDLPNLKISGPDVKPRTTIDFENRGLLLHFCVNWATNSENGNHHLIQRALICKTWKFQAQMIIHALPRTTRGSGNCQCRFTRLHALTRISHSLDAPTRYTCQRANMSLQRHDVMHDVISHYPDLTQADPVWLIHHDLVWIACKKNLKKTLTKWTFDFDQKVKIFKRGLSHSVFCVHSNFGIRFIIWNSEIAQTSNFQKVDFFINLDRKSKFSRMTCLAQFFA